jgi:hypothetical protein
MQRSGVPSRAGQIGQKVQEMTGGRHWLTLTSIGLSLAAFLAGKRSLGLFFGMWPPMIQAFRASARRR